MINHKNICKLGCHPEAKAQISFPVGFNQLQGDATSCHVSKSSSPAPAMQPDLQPFEVRAETADAQPFPLPFPYRRTPACAAQYVLDDQPDTQPDPGGS